MADESERCGTCRFIRFTEKEWISADGFQKKAQLECRIRSTSGYFPVRDGGDWCGEYQPHPAGEPNNG